MFFNQYIIVQNIKTLNHVRNKDDFIGWNPTNLTTLRAVITNPRLCDYYYIVKRIYNLICKDKEEIIKMINIDTSKPNAKEIFDIIEYEISKIEEKNGEIKYEFFSKATWRRFIWELKHLCD